MPSPTVRIDVPREVVEREVMFELMALRDENLLRTLGEEERQRLGENPAGRLAFLTADEIAAAGSITYGVGCKGTPAFSNGATCKILKIPVPGRT